ncbi:CopD family protein, partial [Streptomyces sp. DT225]
VVLVATGVYQTWRQVGTWSALNATGYGQLLLVKVGLVAVLVGIASMSRRWTGRLAEGGDAPAAVAPETGEEPEAGPEAEAETAEDPARAAQLARQRAAGATA